MWPVPVDERTVGVVIQVIETTPLHGKVLAMNERCCSVCCGSRRGYFEPSVLEYMDLAVVAPTPIYNHRVSLAQQGRHL
jgi:hypothetical protein